MNDLNLRYLEFASSISFFEFYQKEYKDPHFKTEEYQVEITKLSEKSNWTLNELSLFLRQYPKSYEIFQEIFQLQRFTNTQLTHFLFDISILNSMDKKLILKYLETNLKNDPLFNKIFLKNFKELSPNNFKKIQDIYDILNSGNIGSKVISELVFLLKLSIQNYIDRASKSVAVIHDRIINDKMTDVSIRIASYIINNLNLNEIQKCFVLDEYLRNKRMPIDTKSIHGNFGIYKISKILDKNGFINCNDIMNKTLDDSRSRFSYSKETKIQGITKNDGKEKKFDFVLYYETKPIILIETNFYSTSGSKININDDEYTYLDEEIKHNNPDLKFMWISDGNYWLTIDGKKRFMKLYERFENRILNYALFEKELPNIKKEHYN